MKNTITKEDYLTRVAATKKAARRFDMIFVPVIFIPLILLMGPAKQMDQYFGDHKPTWVVVATFGFLFGYVAILGAIGWLNSKRILRKYGLACPKCGKQLVLLNGDSPTSQIVIATGKCGHCGIAVLEE